MLDPTQQHVPDPRAISPNVSLFDLVLSATTKAALKAVPRSARASGMIAVVTADRSRWVFDEASAVSDTTDNLVLTPDAGTGRWLRVDKRVHLKLPIGFGTADAAALFTTPTGFRLALARLWWEVTTGFTGGTGSAIGVSSGSAPHATKGDLLGGATGDVAATLVAGACIPGTVGADYASNGQPFLAAGTTLRFDRITDAFTAGAGFVHVLCDVID